LLVLALPHQNYRCQF